ncbi:MAG: glycosyltransferase [bacterium]|nr:glycosyltransferase [bacterium]
MFESKAFRKGVIVGTAAVALLYLGFRVLLTINMESAYAIAASVMLLAAEGWGIFLMLLYLFQIWDTSDPEPVAPTAGKRVDVYLPTYNEDAQLLRGSINALNQLDYPHTTYVLDDGNRAEVKELCQEMGVEYIARDNNKHAKAGNLNNALDQTDGEFVIIFDADHIAKPNFISRLVGYFEDEKLAFIQTPHAFYNLDNFQSSVDYKSNSYWEEGQLFYNVIQPGKNYWNANVFCGSAAMFRRTALEEVGCVAIETITEDMHTGLRLHAKGWKSLFVNERMISAQAAPDVTTFATQRLRWGEGNLSIMAYDNPLTIPGLTIAQRINYLASMLGWTTGVAKVGLYLAPIMMLFSGVSPVSEFSLALGLITVVYLLTTWSAVKLLSNGYGRLWEIEVQAMSSFWLQCRALYRSIANRGRGKFVVTSKRGRQGAGYAALIGPHVALITLGLCAIVWASSKIVLGVSEDYFGLAVGSVLIGIQSIMAFQVIRKALRPADKRFSWRHPTSDIHVNYQTPDATGQAVSLDINETGLGVVAFEPILKGASLDLTLSSDAVRLQCRGEVRNCSPIGAKNDGLDAFRVGIEFVDLTNEQMCDLWTIASRVAVEKQYDLLSLGPKAAKQSRLNNRLPIEVQADSENPISLGTVTKQLFPTLLHFESNQTIDPSQEVGFQMETPAGRVEGRGTVQPTESDGLYELKFDQFHGQSRGAVKAVMAATRSQSVNDVLSPTPRCSSWPVVGPAARCMAISTVASLFCIGFAWFLWQDNYALSSFAASDNLNESQAEEAESLLARIFESNTANANSAALFDARGILEKMGDDERLEQLDQMILEHEPNNVGVNLASANRLLEKKQYADAVLAFQSLQDKMNKGEVSGSRQQQLDVYLGLARSLVAEENDAAAIVAYRNALDYSESRQAALELANLYVEQGAYEKGQELLKLLPEGYEAQIIKSRLAFFDGRFDVAAETLAKLVEENPLDHSTRLLYAESLAAMNRNDDAILQYRTLANADFEQVNSLSRISHLLIAEGRYTDAVLVLDEISLNEIDDDAFFVNYVAVVRQLDQIQPETIDAVERIYRRTLDAKQDCCIKLKQELAEFFAQQGDSDKAVVLLASCTTQEPDNYAVRKRYAELLHDTQQFAEADQQYSYLLKSKVPSPFKSARASLPKNTGLVIRGNR